MATIDMTVYDAILKEIYLPPIREEFNKSTILLDLIKRDMENIDASGKQAILPIHLRQIQSVGARLDTEALPTAGKGVFLQSKVPLKYNYGVLEVTGPTIRASRKDAGAFARAVDLNSKDLIDSMKRDVNRQLIGLGTGQLCLTSSADSGQTFTVDTPGVLYLKVGMLLDIKTSGGASHAAAVEISAINEDTSTVTVTGTITAVADNDIVYRAGVGTTSEITGLGRILDDDTGTLFNISRNTYPEWRAKIYDNSGTNRALTLALMQTTFTHMEKEGSPRDEILLFTTFGVRDKYVDLLTPDKRYHTLELDGGWKAVEYNGRPLICDSQAYPNKIEYLNLKDFSLYSLDELNWADEDGHVLKFKTGYDKYEAILYWDAELGCSRPNAQASLQDITE